MVVGAFAVAQHAPQKLTLAQNLQDNTVSTNFPWVLPLLSEPNKTCTASCNGEGVDHTDLHSDSEAKSCIGTFQVKGGSILQAASNLIKKCNRSYNRILICRSSARATAQMVLVPLVLSVRGHSPPSVATTRLLQSVRVLSRVLQSRGLRPQMASLSSPPGHMAAWGHQLA